MSLWNDVRLATRLLVRDRAFALAAIAALALGLAANATVFTIVNGVFLRELPFTDPDRIVGIETRRVTGSTSETSNVSYPDLEDLQANARLFDGIAGVNQTAMSVADQEHGAERYNGAYISANGFGLLGARPAFGRGFRAEDDRPGAVPVVILGHDIWQRRYGGDPGILGRTIRVNGAGAAVIGVMADGFGFPQTAKLWLPLARFAGPPMERRDARGIEAFGKRRTGVTNEQAEADIDAILRGLARLYPETNSGTGARVIPFRETMIGDQLPGIFAMLLGAVAFLLLIACANVANLSLARGANRAREIALRLSLGATRRQIVRQMVVESLLLSAIAGGLGLVLAAAGARLFVNAVTNTDPPYFLQFPLDGRVLGVVALICLGTAVVFGLAPALHASKVRLSSVLNEAGHGTAGGPRSRRWAGGLVIVQLTLGLILLAGAGVLTRNVVSRLAFDPGVDTAGLLVMKLELPASYGTAESRRTFYERLDARLATTAGMRATVAAWAPTAGGGSQRVSIDGRPSAAPIEAQPRTTVVPVGPRYFETVGIAATNGRIFAADDSRPGRLLAVVNERFAAMHFGARQPLGQRIRLSPRRGPDSADWFTIVGVVPNIRQEEADPREIEPVVYTPYGADPFPFATILARSGQDTGASIAALRRELATIDPDLPVFDAGTLSDLADDEFVLMRVIVSMLAVFAVAAVVLSGIGLYALTAYTATQRTREIGVRVALGARAADVWWLVTRRATMQLGAGLLLGFAGATAVGSVLEGVFESVDGHDPLALGLVGALMLLVAFVADLVPARRALRLDPAVTLRG